jgi:sorting nexin-13
MMRHHSNFHSTHAVLQSTVCVKQLTFAMIEQVLVSLFPELHKLIEDIHEKGHKEQAAFTYQL